MIKTLILSLVIIFNNIVISYGQLSSVESVARSAVLIEYNSKDQFHSATGFFYNTYGSMFLITAGHVLFENIENQNGQVTTLLASDTISISYYSDDPIVDSCTIATLDTKSLFANKQIIYNQPSDLAIIRIGESIPSIGFNAKVLNFKNHRKALPTAWDSLKSISMNNVRVGEDVYLAGYPKSLGFWISTPYEFNRPLIRKGVLAGIDVAHQAIIIDCPSYPGNSGGPVAIAIDSTLRLLGVVSRFVPLVKMSESLLFHTINKDIDNSGYSAIMPIMYVDTLIKRDFTKH